MHVLEKRIAALEDMVKDLRAACDQKQEIINADTHIRKDHTARTAALEAENERLRNVGIAVMKEAEFYRWLKENADYASTVVGNIEVTDEAIEAAMRGEA